MTEFLEGKKPHSPNGHGKSNAVPIKPIITGLSVVILIGVSFFGGVSYQKSKQPLSAASAPNQSSDMGFGGQGGMGGRGMFGGQRPNIGEVSSVSSNSITILLQSGDEATYTISDTTTVTDGNESTTVSNIKTGDSVLVVTSNNDAKEASNIILNPQMMRPGQSNSQGSEASPVN